MPDSEREPPGYRVGSCSAVDCRRKVAVGVSVRVGLIAGSEDEAVTFIGREMLGSPSLGAMSAEVVVGLRAMFVV